jgi:hypothetical protein
MSQPNKPMVPTAPLLSRPLPPGRVPRVPPRRRSLRTSRPRPLRPAITSLAAVLAAASLASFHHVALPRPGRPLPARPSTTSLFAVLSAAHRASFHHFALRVPLARAAGVHSRAYSGARIERAHSGTGVMREGARREAQGRAARGRTGAGRAV